jgi:hypothetical protein
MRSPPSRQRDLFEVDQKMLDIPEALRAIRDAADQVLGEANRPETRP